MDDIEFLEVPSSYIPQVEAWFGQDATGRLLKLPGTGFTPGETDTYAWAALHDQQPIAIATLGFNAERVGHLNFAVKPSERRHGVGGQLVQYVLQQPAVRAVGKLHVLVELDNVAAQKILDHHRFSRVGDAPDGRIVYERH